MLCVLAHLHAMPARACVRRNSRSEDGREPPCRWLRIDRSVRGAARQRISSPVGRRSVPARYACMRLSAITCNDMEGVCGEMLPIYNDLRCAGVCGILHVTAAENYC